MSGKTIEFMKQQKYRFDFGTDEKLCTVIFNAAIPQAELKSMVSSLQNCLYEKIPDVIFSYLKQHHLEYSNFNNIEILLENYDVMEWAGYLLHSDTYKKVDENLENTDIYYAVMDYQKNIPRKRIEGCYYVLKRLALGNGEFQHNFIGQAFCSDIRGCEANGCFAIRKTSKNTLYTIDHLEDEPFLPSFGCVHITALLSNLENFKTREQVLSTAVK